MTKKNIYILLGVLCLIGCQHTPEVEVRVRECAPMPSPRATACACTMDGKAYVFGGRNQEGKYLNDIWQYDPQTDTWTSMGDAPIAPRIQAAMNAYDGSIYLGLGFGQGSVYDTTCYYRDWWRWTPSTHEWKKLDRHPRVTVIDPKTYVVGSRIYTIYGTGDCFSRYVIYYNTATEKWRELPDNYHRALSAFCGVGAMYDGICYYGLGNNTSNLRQWYQVDLLEDEWTRRTSIPGKGRVFSACSASKKGIYVYGGRYFAGEHTGGEVFSTFMRYIPDKDQWEYCGEMPCGKAENQIAFTIDGKAYFGLGEDEHGTIFNKLYCIED